MGILITRDPSSLQYFGFPPSRTSFFISAATFTKRFVNPAVDPACLIIHILVILVVLTVFTILNLVDLIVLIVIMGEYASENH